MGFPVRVVSASRSRSALAFEQSLSYFIQTTEWGGYFWTLTLPGECPARLADLGEVRKMFGKVEDWLRRQYPEATWMGVWELQERGAWHPHFITDARIDVTDLRAFAVSVGFGQMMKVKPVINRKRLEAAVCGLRPGGVVNLDSWVGQAVRYLSKYLLKGHEGCAEVKAGRHSLMFAGGKRGKLWSSACRKVGFAARAWRFGMEWFWRLHNRLPRSPGDFQEVMDLGWHDMSTHPEDSVPRKEWEFVWMIENLCPF